MILAAFDLPSSAPPWLGWAGWGAAMLVAVIIGLARGVEALRSLDKSFAEKVDERFKAAMRSDEFGRVVDSRVAAAFDGATAPLLAGQRELAGQVAVAQKSVDAAHRRIDEHLERAPA